VDNCRHPPKYPCVFACIELIKQYINAARRADDPASLQSNIQYSASLLYFLAQIEESPSTKHTTEPFIRISTATLIELDSSQILPKNFNPLANTTVRGEPVDICLQIIDKLLLRLTSRQSPLENIFHSIKPLIIWLSTIKLKEPIRNRVGFYVAMTLWTLEHYDKAIPSTNIRQHFYAKREPLRLSVINQ